MRCRRSPRPRRYTQAVPRGPDLDVVSEAELFAIAPGAELFELRRLRTLDGLPVALDASLVPLAVAPEPPPTPEAPKSPLHLVVSPKGRCWVQVSADGTVRVAREVAAGETLAIDASERLQVVVGNAGAFAYELNGRPGKSLGAAGQVARATIVPATVPQFQEP